MTDDVQAVAEAICRKKHRSVWALRSRVALLPCVDCTATAEVAVEALRGRDSGDTVTVPRALIVSIVESCGAGDPRMSYVDAQIDVTDLNDLRALLGQESEQ